MNSLSSSPVNISPSSPPLSPPDNEKLKQYCFNNPGLPYIKSRQPPPPPYCIQTTDNRINTVKDICSAYGQCEYKSCKSSFTGHAVMCPTQDFFVSSCLYQWAKLGPDSDKEKEFLKNGTMFANFDVNNAQDCINVDNLFKV